MTYSGVVSNGGCFPSLGNSSYRLVGGVFDPTKFVLNSHGGLSPWIGWARWATLSKMQLHCMESRGYHGVEVGEESICSAQGTLGLSDSRSWKPQVRMLSLGF